MTRAAGQEAARRDTGTLSAGSPLPPSSPSSPAGQPARPAPGRRATVSAQQQRRPGLTERSPYSDSWPAGIGQQDKIWIYIVVSAAIGMVTITTMPDGAKKGALD